MAIQHELELYEPLKRHFEQQGYEVKGEVNYCDLVAIHPVTNETVIVEMKKTFTLALLLQGVERLSLTNSIFLAVERNRTKKGAVNQQFGRLTELCRRLGLGLITVTFFSRKAPQIDVFAQPTDTPTKKNRPKKLNKLVQEFRGRSGDYNIGGTTQTKLLTAYREKCLKIAYAMKNGDVYTPSQLRQLLAIATVAQLLRDNYYGWFEKVARGKYRITDEGRLALDEYHFIFDAHYV